MKDKTWTFHNGRWCCFENDAMSIRECPACRNDFYGQVFYAASSDDFLEGCVTKTKHACGAELAFYRKPMVKLKEHY